MNAELVKELRHCGKGGDVAERCLPCGYYDCEPWCEAALVNDAADALEAADKRIAELEAHMPKECEFNGYADKIQNARNRYCTQCGAYLSDEEFENHTIRYCYWCGSKVKGEKK